MLRQNIQNNINGLMGYKILIFYLPVETIVTDWGLGVPWANILDTKASSSSSYCIVGIQWLEDDAFVQS